LIERAPSLRYVKFLVYPQGAYKQYSAVHLVRKPAVAGQKPALRSAMLNPPAVQPAVVIFLRGGQTSGIKQHKQPLTP
jgi:hypothetical protein